MGISGRIARLFLMASRMTPLLALVAFLLGVFATLVTPREEEPQIDVTMADVFVAFPALRPRDVENLVASCRAGAVADARVEHVYSVSRPGMAVITVQFEVGVRATTRSYAPLTRSIPTATGCPNLGVAEPVIKPGHRRCAHRRASPSGPAILTGRPSTCSRWREPWRSS